MRSDRIISVLLGLIGACGNNPKTLNTDAVVLKALAISEDCSEEAESRMISEIIEEKYAVSPNCAACTMPCGNTSDYDMSRLYNSEVNIREAKLSILSALREIASYLHNGDYEMPPEVSYTVYKALAYIGYDIDEKNLAAMLCEVEKTYQRLRRNENAEKNN